MTTGTGARSTAGQLDLDYTRTMLDNGLVVIVHEDPSATAVSLSVCYRVGSKDEGPGQTGSAHLFEHLMFTGSANLPGNFAPHLTAAGATRINAYTTPDHTCFFATVPPGALEFALYAEADRMGPSFRDHLDHAGLAQQQAIVLEEKAQREGSPAGRVPEIITRGLFPIGHPYRHTVIGSVEDIAGMTLDAAREWHRRFYGPDNAAIIIAGPIDPAAVVETVRAHFSYLERAGARPEAEVWIPASSLRRRDRTEIAAEHGGLIYLAWPVPEATDSARVGLELVAALLAGSEISELQRALVRPGGALNVSAGVTPGALCSQFVVSIVLDTGADPRIIEAQARNTIATFLAGPAPAEAIDRLRGGRRAGIALALGQLGAKVRLMIEGEMLSRNPGAFQHVMVELDRAGAEDLLSAARRWLGNEPFVLVAHSTARSEAVVTPSLRPGRPAISAEGAEIVDPPFDTKVLPSGLRLTKAPRAGARDFLITLELARGTGSEAPAERGLTMLVAAMPFHGIGARDAVALRRFTDETGIQLGMGASASHFSLRIGGPASAATAAAAMLADLVLRPRFEADILEQHKHEQGRVLQAAASDPMMIMSRLPAALLYGTDSTETRLAEGVAEVVGGSTVAQLEAFHRRLFNPSGATLLALADPATLAALGEAFGGLLAEWTAGAPLLPEPVRPALPERNQECVHLIPGGPADQALVTLATLLPAREGLSNEVATAALAYVVQHRLHARLRDELGWTYGVGASVISTELPGLPPRLQVQGAIAAEHVAEAIVEIRAVLAGLASGSPPTGAELADHRAQTRAGLLASLAHSDGTGAAVSGATRLTNPVTLSARIEELSVLDPSAVRAVAADVLSNGPAEWVIASSAPALADQLVAAGMPVLGMPVSGMRSQ